MFSWRFGVYYSIRSENKEQRTEILKYESRNTNIKRPHFEWFLNILMRKDGIEKLFKVCSSSVQCAVVMLLFVIPNQSTKSEVQNTNKQRTVTSSDSGAP